MDDPLLAELLDLEHDIPGQDRGPPATSPMSPPTSQGYPAHAFSHQQPQASAPPQGSNVAATNAPAPSQQLPGIPRGPPFGGPAQPRPPSTSPGPASRPVNEIPRPESSAQHKRVNPQALMAYLSKFTTLHWNMLFGALHRHDAALKSRLEPIYSVGYPRLKAAAQAGPGESYVQTGLQVFRQLSELIPEDRLASLMQKCVAHLASDRAKRQQQQQQQPGAVEAPRDGGRPPSAAAQAPPTSRPPSAQGASPPEPPPAPSVAAAPRRAPEAPARESAPAGAKRPASGRGAEGGRDSNAKRPRGGAGRGGGRDRGSEGGDLDEILGADAFIDMERETDTLMAGLHVQRTHGQATVAPQQTLSEWRVGNECMRRMRAAGLTTLAPSCFEVIQRAFAAHAEALLRGALRLSRQRADPGRRGGGVAVTHDPRRGVLRLERAAREAADAKLAAEREALLKAAGQRRADDETKERAQRAKAELAGRAQASAANAAIAATLGGRAGKWSRFDRWKDKGAKKDSAATAAGDGKKAAAGGDAGATAAAPEAKSPAAGDAGGQGQDPETLEASDGSIAGLLAAAQQRAAEEERRKKAAAEEEERKKAATAAAQAAPGTDAQVGGAVRKLFGSSTKSKEDDTETLGLADLLAALERDSHYAKSEILYRWRNKPIQG